MTIVLNMMQMQFKQKNIFNCNAYSFFVCTRLTLSSVLTFLIQKENNIGKGGKHVT